MHVAVNFVKGHGSIRNRCVILQIEGKKFLSAKRVAGVSRMHRHGCAGHQPWWVAEQTEYVLYCHFVLVVI